MKKILFYLCVMLSFCVQTSSAYFVNAQDEERYKEAVVQLEAEQGNPFAQMMLDY